MLYTTSKVSAVVRKVHYTINIPTLHRNEWDVGVELNDIGRLHLRTNTAGFVDSYQRNRNIGIFILVDEYANSTVAAGMIL